MRSNYHVTLAALTVFDDVTITIIIVFFFLLSSSSCRACDREIRTPYLLRSSRADRTRTQLQPHLKIQLKVEHIERYTHIDPSFYLGHVVGRREKTTTTKRETKKKRERESKNSSGTSSGNNGPLFFSSRTRRTQEWHGCPLRVQQRCRPDSLAAAEDKPACGRVGLLQHCRRWRRAGLRRGHGPLSR